MINQYNNAVKQIGLTQEDADAPNRKYLIVAVNGCLEIQKWVVATTEKEAREKFWLSLSEGERNNAESIECIDEENDN